MESIYDCFKLNNDMKIPCVGFGTYKAAEGNNVEILKTAIEAGYRYFDTASFYQTEDFLGQAIRESNLPREDTEVSLAFDKELLYKNMVDAKADWLYELPQWDKIFTEEKKKVLYKEQKNARTIHVEKKVYPNDPCPCGSGKKYKKCCGKNK